MPKFPKDGEHLIRMAALFVVGLVLFLIARALFVPKDFHELGHFRTSALADNMARPIAFAGQEACASCHPDIVEERKGSRHATIRCEACHGALARHAEDPSRAKQMRPDGQKVCLVCHGQDVAKPATFKQVNPKEHMDSAACNSCHKPHHPEIG